MVLLVAGAFALADELDNPPVPPLDTAMDTTINAAPANTPVRIALVDAGVNYLLPEINRALARDDEGQLIAYDFWDMDNLPFDSHPVSQGNVQRHGTQTASLIIREAPFAQLVAYRYPRPDMSRMADLVEHADRHGVGVVGMPLGGNKPEQWHTFEKVASQYPHILFVASAGNNGRDIDSQPVYPAALTLPNMLVVTSADNFGQLASGVNWGRVAVDYMVPAEYLQVLRFDGIEARVSGSSYAVPRVVALAARYLHADPKLTALEIIKKIRNQFGNGAAPRQLSQGYLYDPQFDPRQEISVAQSYRYNSTSNVAVRRDEDTSEGALVLPLEVLVLDSQWTQSQILQLLEDTEQIFEQCNIAFDDANVNIVDGPDYLRDLDTGSARTLLDAVRSSGADRKLTVVLARDTRMATPFDAEAFGRGNTRHRAWLTDSVWLTQALQDREIALAHELFHVLVNSGEHSEATGSLMLARTTGSNTTISSDECKLARDRSLELGLVKHPE